ncbi:MAG: DUF3943 domain-containing protein [Sandaracinaceae bacterium]
MLRVATRNRSEARERIEDGIRRARRVVARCAVAALAWLVVVVEARAQDELSSRATPPPEAARPVVPPRAPGPDYLRTALWELSFLIGGTVWYWIDDRNIVDWDLDGWERRFDESSYRFDNNEFPINFVGHPLSGGAYYGLPRANRLPAWESFLFGAATSFVWEFFLEFHERFSINDIVATPLGGVPIGETFVRLGRWLDSSQHPALAWTFGLPVAIHEALDGREVGVRDGDASDEDPGWGAIDVDFGFAWVLPGQDRAGPGFDVSRIGALARFVALDGYLEDGQRIDGFFDAEVTRMRVEGLGSTEGAGFELEADTILAGVHASALRASPLGGRMGTSVIVGTSVSHFFRFEHFARWHERLSYTGFPGFAVEAQSHLGPAVISFDGRAQGVFGASNASYELSRWRAAHPLATPKSVLTRHQYWFGWGYTLLGRVALHVAPVTLAAEGRYLVLDSEDRYDRNQDDVTEDADGYGQLLETVIEARIDLGDALMLRARWLRQRRYAALDDVASRGRLDRFELAVGAAFR